MKSSRRKFLKALTGISAGFFLSKLIPKTHAYDSPNHDASEITGNFKRTLKIQNNSNNLALKYYASIFSSSL
jgi:hypothetical protein